MAQRSQVPKTPPRRATPIAHGKAKFKRVRHTPPGITERERSQKARAHLAAIVESSDDAIISTTLDGDITSWNKGTEELYGYSIQEAVGKPAFILLPPDRPNELNQILEKVKSGQRIQHYETKRMRKDGKIIGVAATVSPIKDSTGTIVGVSAITSFAIGMMSSLDNRMLSLHFVKLCRSG
jgi:PAS domain S-box-containing protein